MGSRIRTYADVVAIATNPESKPHKLRQVLGHMDKDYFGRIRSHPLIQHLCNNPNTPPDVLSYLYFECECIDIFGHPNCNKELQRKIVTSVIATTRKSNPDRALQILFRIVPRIEDPNLLFQVSENIPESRWPDLPESLMKAIAENSHCPKWLATSLQIGSL